MLIVYVDDIMHFDRSPGVLIERLEGLYRLKDTAKAQDRYLGANIDRVQLKDGSTAWLMSIQEYLQNVIENLEKELEKQGKPQVKTYSKNSGDRLFALNYRPKIEVSPELREVLQTHSIQLIGILRWNIEIRMIEIITEVSLLSQHQYIPIVGNLEDVYRVYCFLKCALKKIQEAWIIFDST